MEPLPLFLALAFLLPLPLFELPCEMTLLVLLLSLLLPLLTHGHDLLLQPLMVSLGLAPRLSVLAETS